MPFDLEAEIARRLRVSPETVGPVLNAVIERIRQQVSHFGYARVAGLGTFRGHNGHLAFEPEPVLADEVNARFAGLEVLDVSPAREDDDVEAHEAPDADDETLYGPTPGDDYERGDAGMDEEGEREDIEGADEEGAEDLADAHATIKPVYDTAGEPGAEYDLEIPDAGTGEFDELPPGGGADEPTYADAEMAAPPSDHPEDAERADEAYWTGEEEEHPDDVREPAGWADGQGEDWRAGEELRADAGEGSASEMETPEVEGMSEAGWVDDTADPDTGDERFVGDYEPAAEEPTETDPTEWAETPPTDVEPSEAEPTGYEKAGYEPVEGEWEEDRSAESEAPEDPSDRRPAVEWNPSEERSDADRYADDEAAIAAGAFGGAAAAAGGEEEFVDEDEVFSEAGEDDDVGRVGGDYGEEYEHGGDYEGVESGYETEEAGLEGSLQTESDRASQPARESADPRPSAASAATSDAVAGRRSAVLISIGIVVVLAAAALIYLATSSSPVGEPEGPAIAETPTTQDTTAAASEGDGAAASDTTDLANTPPPADPTSDRAPATETPLDPLRGAEPIDRAAGGYTLVVFSDFSDSNANSVAATYREQGFRTGVLDDQSDGRIRFRVSVGQFSTLDEAVEARDRLAGNGLPEDAWVRRIQ